MAIKLLVFGLPGSGKSTIAHHISNYLNARNWESSHFSEHTILEEMFLADGEHKRFKPADKGGFDVLDFTVFDIALQKLAYAINQHFKSAKLKEIILIEFSRNDYWRAFRQFSQEFLHDAFVLYIAVEIEVCKRRVYQRIAHPNTINVLMFLNISLINIIIQMMGKK